ncbi:uroporphyrinogen decarboxylase/cobalamine-independent methonine synthase family protein [Lolliginicoccus suaedae]|uniref:methionine synthase n=1 Tax=Lolliginicoccus suaedae TaxID=2605429 RepID=UPI0011ECB5F3|nr:methionine synthase [Lolliginicoccus suaedae]
MSLLAGTVTGMGHWPGASMAEAITTVLGELAGHGVPFQPMMQDRGAGSDPVGQAAVLLVDMPVEASATGYRLAQHHGIIGRRARDWHNRDTDQVVEAWETSGGAPTWKIQVTGPVTLGRRIELPNGHAVLEDRGALRDLAASLAEGVARHVARLEHSLGCKVIVEWLEPALQEALDGSSKPLSILQPPRRLPAPEAVGLWAACAGIGADQAVRCGAAVPWSVVADGPFGTIVVGTDATSAGSSLRDSALIDGLGRWFDTGRHGVLAVDGREDARTVARRILALGREAGLGGEQLLERVGIAFDGSQAGSSREMVAGFRHARSVRAAFSEVGER